MPGHETPATPGAVLFACGLNSIRSPMAAAVARHFFGHRLHAASAGVRAGQLDPFAVEAMREIGIDISDHEPRAFDALEDTNFDLVISLAPEAHHHALELTRTHPVEAEYWPMPDPAATTGNREQRLDAYRVLRDMLVRRIRARFGAPPAPNP